MVSQRNRLDTLDHKVSADMLLIYLWRLTKVGTAVQSAGGNPLVCIPSVDPLLHLGFPIFAMSLE